MPFTVLEQRAVHGGRCPTFCLSTTQSRTRTSAGVLDGSRPGRTLAGRTAKAESSTVLSRRRRVRAALIYERSLRQSCRCHVRSETVRSEASSGGRTVIHRRSLPGRFHRRRRGCGGSSPWCGAAVAQALLDALVVGAAGEEPGCIGMAQVANEHVDRQAALFTAVSRWSPEPVCEMRPSVSHARSPRGSSLSLARHSAPQGQ